MQNLQGCGYFPSKLMSPIHAGAQFVFAFARIFSVLPSQSAGFAHSRRRFTYTNGRRWRAQAIFRSGSLTRGCADAPDRIFVALDVPTVRFADFLVHIELCSPGPRVHASNAVYARRGVKLQRRVIFRERSRRALL